MARAKAASESGFVNRLQVTGFEVAGPLLIRPRVHADERGYFYESWRHDLHHAAGVDAGFVQTNVSRSRQGVLRGLHFQRSPHQQGKLVSVVRGGVLDVAVDLREGSTTYGRHVMALLDDESHAHLWVPRGFAHGFLALTAVADVVYQVDSVHAPETEGGVHWNDPDLAIDWDLERRLGIRQPLTSPRDAALPRLRDGVAPLSGE